MKDHFSRRQVLSTVGAFSTLAGVTPASVDAQKEKDEPRFGYSINEAWNYEPPSPDSTVGAITETAIYVAFNPGQGFSSGSHIGKINRFTGEKIWSRDIDANVVSPRKLNGRLYFSGDQTVYCWDAATGDTVWETPVDFELLVSVFTEETGVYAIGYELDKEYQAGQEVIHITNSTLLAFDPATGELDWEHQSAAGIIEPSLSGQNIICRENNLDYINGKIDNNSGNIKAIDTENGVKKWISDGINPVSVTSIDDFIVSITKGDDLIIFETDGERRWTKRAAATDYFVTEDRIAAIRPDGDVTVHHTDRGGEVEQTFNVSSEATAVRIPADSDTLLIGNSDQLVAQNLSTSETQWQTSVEAAPESIFADQGIVLCKLGADGALAVDIDTGEKRWETSFFDPEFLNMSLYNGYIYLHGNGMWLHGYRGKRGQALAKHHTLTKRTETIGGELNTLMGWGSYLSQAESAIEAGNYQQALDLLDSYSTRYTLMQSVLGVGGLGAVYASARGGVSRLQQGRIESAMEQLEELYPISDGALSGVEPSTLITQAETAHDAAGGLTGSRLRILTDDSYAGLLDRLQEMAEMYGEIQRVSSTAAALDKKHVPDGWVATMRDAIDEGQVETVQEMENQLTVAGSLSEDLSSLEKTIKNSSLDGSTDSLAELIAAEVSSDGEDPLNIPLNELCTILESGISDYKTHRQNVDVVDLTDLKGQFESVLENPADISQEKIQKLNQFKELISVIAEVDTRLDQIDFTAVTGTREQYVAEAQQLFARRDTGELRRLSSELHNLSAGRWSREDLFAISATDFEYVVGALFNDMGYSVTVSQEQSDKGVDVIARNDREVIAIQVKQYRDGNTVGRPTVQQMVGAMAMKGADRAIILTSGMFTTTAIDASRELGEAVQLINGDEVLELLTESMIHPSKAASYYRSKVDDTRDTRDDPGGSNGRRSHNSDLSPQTAYEILNLDPPVTQDEIEAHYRERVKEVHPDMGGDAAEFKRVKRAYDLLISQ